MGDLGRIEAVADKIAAAYRAGDRLIVVVSAMAGETDRLLQLARTLCDRHRPNPRELDVLLASGEQVTMALLCMALEIRQLTARSYTGAQVRILTDSAHTKARVLDIDCSALERDLHEGRIPVVAGFQGITSQGDVTTLGRGGSDTTAVALAAAMQADECQIFTDVDGVYTTDPRMVPEARRLASISVEEMLEMASLGSKVLQIRAVEFAGRYKVPLRVLSTFEPGPGTLIRHEAEDVEQAVISGIAFNRDEAELTVLGIPDAPGTAWRILEPIAGANIEVDMIVQNVAQDGRVDFTFTVHRSDYAQALDILRHHAPALGAGDVSGSDKVAKISLVGVGVRSHAGIAVRLFRALAEENIKVRMVSTSEVKISVLVEEPQLETGVRALHRAFELDREGAQRRPAWQGGAVKGAVSG